MTTIAARLPVLVPQRWASLPTVPQSPDRLDVNWRELAARQANNLIVHIALNDTPALLSIANVANLPPALEHGLQMLNGINFATGCLGLALSIRELRTTLRNPNATRMDKAVDIGRLVVSDVVATGCALMPFVPGLLNHPVGAAIFVGAQVAGVGADIVKTVYDASRKGAQAG